MSYLLLLADKAKKQLAKLPEEFIDRVEERLLELAESPTRSSIPIAHRRFLHAVNSSTLN